MTSEYELTFSDYLSILRRRAPYLLGIFVAVLLAAILFAIFIPTTYRATGTIMVESQKISGNSTSMQKSQLDDQLNIIRQRVLTRDKLVQIANQHKLFKEKLGPQVSAELLDRIRKRIIIETGNPRENLYGAPHEQQAISFTLSFDDQRPEVALAVTNELIYLFLDWNIKLRTGEATETTAFFTQETNRLKAEVDRLDNKIADYRKQHKNSMPEQANLRENILTRAERDLREVERDYRSTKDEIQALEVELAASRHGIDAENSFQTLPALQAEYARLSAIYNDSHPDVRRIKRKIELMEQTSGMPGLKSAANNTAAKTANPVAYRIQAKIDADKTRLAALARQSDLLREKITDNENAMTSSPKVEQGLEMLVRDRDSAEKKYEELRNRQMNAKIAENLESGTRSGRFSVLEAPLLPERPFKPDRVKILILGFLLALASSGGAMMLLETLDKRVRGIEALTHVLGARPMVVIPYIPLESDVLQSQRMRNLTLISASTLLMLVATLLYFM